MKLFAGLICLVWLLPIKTLNGQENVYCQLSHANRNIAWSPNGEYLAIGYKWHLFIYDSQLQQEAILQPDYKDKISPEQLAAEDFTYYTWKRELVMLIWMPDSEQIFTMSSGSPGLLWELPTSNYQTIIDVDFVGTSDIAIDPDGQILATASVTGPGGASIILWDIALGQWINSGMDIMNSTNYDDIPVSSLAWHPKKNILASGDIEGNIVTWNIDTNKLLTGFNFSSSKIETIVWNPHVDEIAMGYSDGTLALWNLENEQRVIDKFETNISSIAWNTEGTLVAAASLDGAIKILEPNTMAIEYEIMVDPSASISLSWHENKLAIFSCTGILQILNTENYKIIQQLTLPEP